MSERVGRPLPVVLVDLVDDYPGLLRQLGVQPVPFAGGRVIDPLDVQAPAAAASITEHVPNLTTGADDD